MLTKLVKVTTLALAVMVAPLAALAQDASPVGSYKLAPTNAEVLASEDHSRPWVVLDTYFGSGSSSDFPGYAGIAAATAHAVWSGGKRSAAEAVAALGGDSKVFVDRTVTHFQARLPADKLEDGMAAVGGAFSYADWNEIDPDKSAKAFVAAARQSLGDARERAFQLFMEEAFERDFGHPVYGRGMPRFERADMQAYFERYYVPGRMKVVLVGDFNSGKAVGQVIRGYAALLKRQPSAGNLPTRPEGQATRTQPRPARPLVLVGARGPDISNPREQAAMEILLAVMAGTPNSRLDKSLQEPNVARVDDARWVRSAGPAALAVMVEAEPAAVPTVQQGISDLLADLRTNPISLDEHSKAMSAVVKKAESYNQGIETRAIALGFAGIGAGDPNWVKTYPEIVRQVSRQDVMAAAQKYLAAPAVKVLTISP
jgi:predicted Zn-dependent peptidase